MEVSPMNIDKLQLEARQLLADWFVPVAVLLLLVAAASAVGVYSAVATPAEPTEYDTVDRWSTTADFSHSTTVSEPNAVYPVGEQLTDQPRYYTEVMPALQGEIQYSYQAADGDVNVETELTQVTRAVEDGADGSAVYWQTEQSLDGEQASGLAPGDTHTDSFTVDVRSMDQTAAETAESLGSTAGTLETVVQVDVRMDGTIDGEPVEHTEQYELPITVTSGTYTVEVPSETGHVEQQTVAVSGGWSDTVGDAVGVIALLVLSLGSLGGLAAAKHHEKLAPTAAARRAVEAESERAALEEWISRGVLPPAVADRPRIEVASLTELVDVAIDCNRRVIDRKNAAEYVVVDDAVLYGFSPEISENASAEPLDNVISTDEDDADRPETTAADTAVSERESHSADDTTVDSKS